MAAPVRAFEVVGDEDETIQGTGPVPSLGAAVQGVAVSALMLALRTLSQRALVALADLFCLLTCASVFWLWLTIPDPNPHQLVGLGMYAIFTLAANLIVRRK
jgi:hypothetical protein